MLFFFFFFDQQFPQSPVYFEFGLSGRYEQHRVCVYGGGHVFDRWTDNNCVKKNSSLQLKFWRNLPSSNSSNSANSLSSKWASYWLHLTQCTSRVRRPSANSKSRTHSSISWDTETKKTNVRFTWHISHTQNSFCIDK